MLNEFDKVVFTQEYRGYPAGTMAYYIGSTTDSGHTVAMVAIIDSDFTSFLEDNGFASLEDHVKNKKDNCWFGTSQWYNPFTIAKPYFNGIASKTQLDEIEKKALSDIEEAKLKLEHALKMKDNFQ